MEKKNNEFDGFLLVKEVALLLRVSKRYVYRLIREKNLPCHQMAKDGKMLFDKTEVLNWLKINSNSNS